MILNQLRTFIYEYRATATLLAGLALALLLSGCAGPTIAQLDAAEDSVIVDTADQRALRAGALAAIAAEMATDRVYREDAQDAGQVYVFISQLERAINQIRTADAVWSHADLFDAKRIIVIAAGDRVKSRVLSRLTSFGLGDALKSLSQGAKGVAMLLDVRELLAAVRAGETTLDEAWAAVDGRVKRNKARLTRLVEEVFGPFSDRERSETDLEQFRIVCAKLREAALAGPACLTERSGTFGSVSDAKDWIDRDNGLIDPENWIVAEGLFDIGGTYLVYEEQWIGGDEGFHDRTLPKGGGTGPYVLAAVGSWIDGQGGFIIAYIPVGIDGQGGFVGGTDEKAGDYRTGAV